MMNATPGDGRRGVIGRTREELMVTRVRVGDAEIVGLLDRRAAIIPERHFPGVPPDALARYDELLRGGPWSLISFRAYLVRADGRSVLIDTGYGPVHAPPGDLDGAALLLDELAGAGASTSDIDLVVFTHLHADHVGWNLVEDRGARRPRFPRARYLAPAADWAHLQGLDQIHPNLREQVLPLGPLGVLDTFAGEHQVLPSLRAVPTPGHSPGHTSFVLGAEGDRCFVLGDVVFHPLVVAEPAWGGAFDWRPDLAAETRERVLARLEADGSPVAAGHFPGSGFGRFVRIDGRRAWSPIEA
jgi:glyoxylase-like metal-dependent hydrolase (beta-lactamase superfamily II)